MIRSYSIQYKFNISSLFLNKGIKMTMNASGIVKRRILFIIKFARVRVEAVSASNRSHNIFGAFLQ